MFRRAGAGRAATAPVALGLQPPCQPTACGEHGSRRAHGPKAHGAPAGTHAAPPRLSRWDWPPAAPIPQADTNVTTPSHRPSDPPKIYFHNGSAIIAEMRGLSTVITPDAGDAGSDSRSPSPGSPNYSPRQPCCPRDLATPPYEPPKTPKYNSPPATPCYILPAKYVGAINGRRRG